MKDKESSVEDSSVPVPEEFQTKVKALLKGANKQQLSFVRECCYECEREQEPEFTDANMPS